MKRDIQSGRPLHPWAAGALLLFVLLGGLPPARAVANQRLARAQEFLDAGQARPAVELIDTFLAKNPSHPEALLLRSTGWFILGEQEKGVLDLDRALELDPTLRQGWLNRAAVSLSEKRYDEAYGALEKAQALDPHAPDNHLNMGAVLLLKGELQAAGDRFRRYLENNADSSQAFYLVASNYSMAGYAALAVEHLKRAVELDEKTRVQARTDPNFTGLTEDLGFQGILKTDTFRPEPGSYIETRLFPTPYDAEEGKLLGAVIDALRRAEIAFEPRVEVTPEWAVIWGELRVRVGVAEQGHGSVQASAPAERFTPQQWQKRIDQLFREIAVQLALGS